MDSLRLIYFFAACMGAIGSHLPDDFRTCSKSEPNFEKCLASSMEDALKRLADGNKHLGVVPLEPLYIDMISVERVQGSSVNIDQKFSKMKLHGLSNTTVKNFHLDLNTHNILIDIFTPVLRTEADFEIKGQLLIFPINGKGPCNITMMNLKATHNISGELHRKKGKDYLRLTNYEITIKPEKIHYSFHNVLGGGMSARLGEEVHKVINENSISVFEEVRPATEKSYGLVFLQIANRIFNKVPLNEIFRD